MASRALARRTRARWGAWPSRRPGASAAASPSGRPTVRSRSWSFSPFGSALDDGHAVEGREAARVAQPELHGMVADVAVAAEDLDGVVGDLERGLARIVPRQIALAGRGLSLVEAGGRLPGEQAHGVDLDRHVGEHERDRLLLRDRLAAGATVPGVVAGMVEGGARGGDGEPRGRQPA